MFTDRRRFNLFGSDVCMKRKTCKHYSKVEMCLVEKTDWYVLVRELMNPKRLPGHVCKNPLMNECEVQKLAVNTLRPKVMTAH